MNIEEKAKEILRSKLTDIDLECYLKGSTLTYNACLEAVKEAINYTRCCETLPSEIEIGKAMSELSELADEELER